MRLFSILFAALLATSAFGRTVSFAEVGLEGLASLFAGRGKEVIQFRAGDRVPLTMDVTGDLINTVSGGEIELEVQQDFQLKKVGDDVLMSFDGQTFVPIADAVRGHISAQARGGDDGRVQILSVTADLWRDLNAKK